MTASSQGRPGRGAIITGAVLIAVSVLGAIVGLSLLGSRIDLNDLTREVVFTGERTSPIPGRIPFRVDRPLSSGGDDSMSVGIAVRDLTASVPDCTLSTASGDPVPAARPFESTLINGDSSYSVVAAARLEPGEYTAACAWAGEPSSAPAGTRFTVGRTLDGDDVARMLGPMLGILAVLGVTGLVFVAGLIVLIVGLVRRSRSNMPEGPEGSSGWPHQPRPGPGQWDQAGQWNQPGLWDQPTIPQQPPSQPGPPSEPPSDDGFPQWPTPPGAG